MQGLDEAQHRCVDSVTIVPHRARSLDPTVPTLSRSSADADGKGRGLTRVQTHHAHGAPDPPKFPALPEQIEAPLGVIFGDASAADRRSVVPVPEQGGRTVPFSQVPMDVPSARSFHRAEHGPPLPPSPRVFHEADRPWANGEGSFSAIQRRSGPSFHAGKAVIQGWEAVGRMIPGILDLPVRARIPPRTAGNCGIQRPRAQRSITGDGP